MENLFDQSLLDFFASTPTQNVALFIIFILIILLFLIKYKENKKEDTKNIYKFNYDLYHELLKTMTEINEKIDSHIRDSESSFKKHDDALAYIDKSNREIHSILNILLFTKIDDCEEFIAVKQHVENNVEDSIKNDFDKGE